MLSNSSHSLRRLLTSSSTPARFLSTYTPRLQAEAAATTPAASTPLSAAASARPVSTRVFTNATLRRQALAQAQPFYISAAQFRKLRSGGFDAPVQTKLPFELRDHKPEFWMRKLRAQEATRLKSDPARLMPEFGAGDKIVVTKYLALNDRTKFERIGGLCLARQNGDRLSASFLMRSHKLGEDYELRFPLHSPFIARIDVVERSKDTGRKFRQKMYYLRDRERSGWEVKIPTMAKPTVAPVSVERVAKESNGKVQMLSFHPMKKQLKLKKAGGLGAEMAAAGAKGGKEAPKKK